MEIAEIYNLLYRLGVTANYTGFFYASYAIYLSVQQPDRLLLVTKWLYPDVAKHYGTSWHAVERNIRTIITIAWENKQETLNQMAQQRLLQKPCPAQFIAILRACVSRNKAA